VRATVDGNHLAPSEILTLRTARYLAPASAPRRRGQSAPSECAIADLRIAARIDLHVLSTNGTFTTAKGDRIHADCGVPGPRHANERVSDRVGRRGHRIASKFHVRLRRAAMEQGLTIDPTCRSSRPSSSALLDHPFGDQLAKPAAPGIQVLRQNIASTLSSVGARRTTHHCREGIPPKYRTRSTRPASPIAGSANVRRFAHRPKS